MHEVYKIIAEPIARALFPCPLMRFIIVKRIMLYQEDTREVSLDNHGNLYVSGSSSIPHACIQ